MPGNWVSRGVACSSKRFAHRYGQSWSCKRKNENRGLFVINVRLISDGTGNNKGKCPVQSQGTSLFRLDFNLLHVYCKKWNDFLIWLLVLAWRLILRDRRTQNTLQYGYKEITKKRKLLVTSWSLCTLKLHFLFFLNACSFLKYFLKSVGLFLLIDLDEIWSCQVTASKQLGASTSSRT